jgi:hypothetical protein
LLVPIIHPCWSGSMSVLVEGAAEPVPSADIEVRDPLRIGNRFRERAQWCGSPESPVGPQGPGKVAHAAWSSCSVRCGSRAWWRLAAAMLNIHSSLSTLATIAFQICVQVIRCHWRLQ